MIRHGRHRTQRTLSAGLAGHLNPVSIKSAAQSNWSMYSQIELDRCGLLDVRFREKKKPPEGGSQFKPDDGVSGEGQCGL
jgi:hypothetical protein